MRRKREKRLSRGDLNRIVDAVFHPLAEKDSRFLWVDAVFHAMVEQNASETIRKFCVYTLPKLVKSAANKNLNRPHRKRRRRRRCHPK